FIRRETTAAALDGHTGTWREPQLSIGHDLFTFGESTGNDHLLALLACHDDRPHLRGAIRLDDVYVLSVLRCLHCREWYDQSVWVRGHLQRGLHEQARPERTIGVGE